MKKIIFPIIVLLLVTSLVGCGGGGGGSKNLVSVSGDATLTTEISSLLHAMASGFANEDSSALANCLDFPFTVQNDYTGITNIFYSRSQFLNDFKFSDGPFNVNIEKYQISNAHFTDNDDRTGTVTYNAYIYMSISNLGSGSENDSIKLELKKIDRQWKIKKYNLISSTVASSIKGLDASINPSIFGSVNSAQQ